MNTDNPEPRKTNWDKLPLFSPKYVQERSDPLQLQVLMNPGSQAAMLAKQWLEHDDKVIGSTEYQEDLAGLIVSATVSYMTGEVNIPAMLESKDPATPIDRVIVTDIRRPEDLAGVSGAALQVVSTYGGPRSSLEEANELILKRAAKKQAKGSNYSKNVELAILVTQRDWRYEAKLIAEKLRTDEFFSAYWTILPFHDEALARFAVNYHPLEAKKQGEGQFIIDITDNVMIRHLGLFFEDGQLDNLTEYLNFQRASRQD